MSDLLITGFDPGSGPTAASIAFVQQASGTSGGTASVVVTMGSSVLNGDFLTAGVCLPPSVTVSSVTDSQFNRWIRNANSYTSGGNAELWSARGVVGGSLTVTIKLSAAASVSANVSEWSGVWYVDPLDQWTANYGTSTTAITQPVAPRTTGDLVIGVVSTGTSVSGPSSSYTALSIAGTGHGVAYLINPGSDFTSWTTGASSVWATCAACYLNGPSGLNPRFQFPETLVEISTTNNFLAPLEGVGVWTNISSYVRSMNLGPLGRQHELDRVQATPAQITVNNRDGSFNPWNSTSFLYNSGLGLRPMNPIKVTAAWNGVTYPICYEYFQSATPAIADVLNVDVNLAAVDILQTLSLKYLSNNNYAQLVAADGAANLKAYYRLGDPIGNLTVMDSSGNNNNGTLIPGGSGNPLYGVAGAFLYDANTAVDLTNGSNVGSGGFNTVDRTAASPISHQPLGSASSWTLETWMKWTGTLTNSTPIQFTGSTISGDNFITMPDPPGLPSGVTLNSVVTGPGIPANTEVIGFEGAAGTVALVLSNNATATGTNQTFNAYTTGQTLFSTTTTSGPVDVRIGLFASGSVTAPTNVVEFGPISGGTYFPIGFSPQQVLDGNWHHVAVTYGSTVATSYVDGIAGASVGTGGSWSNLTNTYVGCDYSAGAYNGFAGTIQDVAMYSQVLTPAQIANHYAIGTWFQSVEYGASVGSAAAGRFNKVLAATGLNPSTILNVPYPFKTLLYAETNSLTTTSALNYMQTQTESEPGLIFQGPDGMVYAYNREYQYLNSTSTTSQAEFADSSSGTFFYDGTTLQVLMDDLDLWNDIQVQSGRSGALGNAVFFVLQSGSSGAVLQEWGPSQSALAAQSASVFGSRTLQGLTSLQMEYDSDALAIAQNYFAWYGVPIERVAQLGINSEGNQGANISQMLGRQLYDAVTIAYTGQTPGPQFIQTSLIEQITHTITTDPGPTWDTVWATSPYELLLYPTYLGVWKFGQPAIDGVLTL